MQLSVGWHRSHIIPEAAGGKREIWNCLLCCADCNLGMSNKHLFLYAHDRHCAEALLRVVRRVEKKNPSVQCPGTLADFVYKNYRVAGFDFPGSIYKVLRQHSTLLEKRLSAAASLPQQSGSDRAASTDEQSETSTAAVGGRTASARKRKRTKEEQDADRL